MIQAVDSVVNFVNQPKAPLFGDLGLADVQVITNPPAPDAQIFTHSLSLETSKLLISKLKAGTG